MSKVGEELYYIKPISSKRRIRASMVLLVSLSKVWISEFKLCDFHVELQSASICACTLENSVCISAFSCWQRNGCNVQQDQAISMPEALASPGHLEGVALYFCDSHTAAAPLHFLVNISPRVSKRRVMGQNVKNFSNSI
ncbi:hypothetical protein ACOME3_009755 [Neoechinorhynchus agilis]